MAAFSDTLTQMPPTIPQPSSAMSELEIKPGERTVSAGEFPRVPSFADKYEEREYLKGRLALSFRVFGKHGFDEGVADLIHVDHEGHVIGGGPNRLLNLAAYAIHAEVHKARPDVNCAAHAHSFYGRTFSAWGRGVDITSQDACAFWNDLAVYDSFKGVVLANEEGRNIAKALGSKKACILQNHGLLTVASTVEAATFWFTSLDKLCHSQLLNDAACARGGRTMSIKEEDAKNTHKTVGSPRAGWFNGLPLLELMAVECKDDYLG
ncbi:hypothetical protein CEP52_014918 [Fusarium oligoseptatum]|uniref:Class II aldolase/adducin N-terminal domain-containing protein n=1 Tax=Fusarium oligoseptatum TaxID=2604345 RepID=A0A428SHW2_9HYPO|nr:hypothetical protein CEP52_014918 [Fusarium oligoseptatum]